MFSVRTVVRGIVLQRCWQNLRRNYADSVSSKFSASLETRLLSTLERHDEIQQINPTAPDYARAMKEMRHLVPKVAVIRQLLDKRKVEMFICVILMFKELDGLYEMVACETDPALRDLATQEIKVCCHKTRNIQRF